MNARHWAAATTLALLLLQWAWHALWLPPQRVAPWTMALAFSLPILPSAILWLRRHPRAGFWGAIAALGYFSHGAMEAWANSAARPFALSEALLSAVLIVAASWDGMRARFAKRH